MDSYAPTSVAAARHAVLHESGANACGGVAFYSFAPRAEFGQMPSAHAWDIKFPDGSRPAVGALLRCATCGHIWSKQVIHESALLVT